MNGFSKDVETVRYTGVLYHSCTRDGISDLIQNFRPDMPVCFSTSSSQKLFGRECVIVLNVENIEGEYTPFDSDAGKNYGWDEFRCCFNTVEQLLSVIDRVIISDSLNEYLSPEIGEEIDDERDFFCSFFENLYYKTSDNDDFYQVNF